MQFPCTRRSMWPPQFGEWCRWRACDSGHAQSLRLQYILPVTGPNRSVGTVLRVNAGLLTCSGGRHPRAEKSKSVARVGVSLSCRLRKAEKCIGLFTEGT